MKKTIILSAAIMFAGATAFAQSESNEDFNRAEHRAEQRVQHMNESMELTDAEQERLLEIYNEYFTERENMDPDVDNPQEVTVELRDRTYEQIIDLVGEERYKEFSEARIEHRTKMRERNSDAQDATELEVAE